MRESLKPAWAAMVATPMRKLWPLYPAVSIPAAVRACLASALGKDGSVTEVYHPESEKEILGQEVSEQGSLTWPQLGTGHLLYVPSAT